MLHPPYYYRITPTSQLQYHNYSDFTLNDANYTALVQHDNYTTPHNILANTTVHKHGTIIPNIQNTLTANITSHN